MLTWGAAADAHAALTRLSGSCFATPSDTDLSSLDADLERYKAASVLRAAPGAICPECWAATCWECGEPVDEDALEEAFPRLVHYFSDLGQPWCARCARKEGVLGAGGA